MKLTAENKEHINSIDYEELLREWRFAPAGNLWLEGETGKYWGERMAKLKAENPGGAVAASKSIGW